MGLSTWLKGFFGSTAQDPYDESYSPRTNNPSPQSPRRRTRKPANEVNRSESESLDTTDGYDNPVNPYKEQVSVPGTTEESYDTRDQGHEQPDLTYNPPSKKPFQERNWYQFNGAVAMAMKHSVPLSRIDEAFTREAMTRGITVSQLKKEIAETPTTDIDGFMAEGVAAKKGITKDKVDPQQLKMGVKVEMEHTDDPVIAEKISLDHLAEIPDYYTRLAAMEAEAKKG